MTAIIILSILGLIIWSIIAYQIWECVKELRRIPKITGEGNEKTIEQIEPVGYLEYGKSFDKNNGFIEFDFTTNDTKKPDPKKYIKAECDICTHKFQVWDEAQGCITHCPNCNGMTLID